MAQGCVLVPLSQSFPKLTKTSADLEVEINVMSESSEECQIVISELRSGIVEKFDSNLVSGKNIFKYPISIQEYLACDCHCWTDMAQSST